MRLLLVAPPGAGKGTQARALSARYGIDAISTGDLLRQQMAAGTLLGEQARAYVERGDLAPDDLMRDLVVQAVTEADRNGGFLLDGYPRTLAQAEEARALARDHGIVIDAAIYLRVSRPELLRRLLGRSESEGRSDDREATIRHRLDVFDHQTQPLLDYYGDRGILVDVNGEQPVEAVTGDIVAALDKDPAAGGSARPGPG